MGENLALKAAVAKLGGTIHRATEAVVVVQRLLGSTSASTGGVGTPVTVSSMATSSKRLPASATAGVPRKAVHYLARLKNILDVVEDSCAAAGSLEPLDLDEVSEHVRKEHVQAPPTTPAKHDVAAALEEGMQAGGRVL